jgi:hypothetical protein
VERIAKILSQTALTQAEVQLLQAALLSALPEFIPEPDRQRAFMAQLFGAVEGGARANLAAVGGSDSAKDSFA